MIDAKRLAELMTPEKLAELADKFTAHDKLPVLTSHIRDALDCAAAVLREVAGRGEAKRRNSVPAQEGDYTQDASRYAAMQGDKPTVTPEDMAMTALPPKRDAPGSTDDLIADLREQLAEMERAASMQKVIEIDLDDPSECIFFDYEQGFCRADADSVSFCRSCIQGTPQGKTAPEWCHARGRVIVKAKEAK